MKFQIFKSVQQAEITVGWYGVSPTCGPKWHTTAYEKVFKGENIEKYSCEYNDSNQFISKTEKTDWRSWKYIKTTYKYDGEGNWLFTLDYVEDGKKSKKIGIERYRVSY